MENGGAGENGVPADEMGWKEILQLDALQVQAEDWKDPSQDGVLAHLFEGKMKHPVFIMVTSAVAVQQSRCLDG